MKGFKRHLLLAVTLAILVVPAHAFRYGVDLADALQSAYTVEDAVDIVADSLERTGYEIVLIVDHAAGAASEGLDLRPTQVVFARPPWFLERALLKRSSTIGIDLPVKVLVFEDADGSLQIRFNPIGYLSDRHDINVRDPLLRVLDRATNRLPELDDGLITVPSTRSLEDTAQALQDAITAMGAFRIPLVLDYGDTTTRPKPILVVFGNPNAGTPLMQNTQEIGIDLPQKMLIWEDREGDVQITYNDPFFIAKRHNVQGLETLLNNISNALAVFAAAAAGE